ncbi:hypothetical protein [Paeniglutamicibacter sp.]|uniref:hypothetical protein n=1 Tax=Paeniglutamicibacter sp. TaxID=1934391 RepID=UPI00398A25AD
MAAVAVALLASLSGCMPSDRSGDLTSATTTENGEAVGNVWTWQKAKAQTQAMELEISKLIPEDKVVKIDRGKTGILLSCSETQHNWNGATTVTLNKGTEPEPLVKAIEAHYQDSRFTIETDLDIVGDHRIQLRSPDTAENYIIVKDGPGTISIDSGSACFTLPEGEYPRGDF